MTGRSISLLLVTVMTFPILADEPAPPAKPWASTFGGGLAITSGNSDTKNFNLAFSTKYDPKTRWLFKADALYLRADANSVKQVDKITADAREEMTVSDRTFAYGEVNFLRDPFKDLDYFVAPLVGAGYRIIKTPTKTLSVDGGVGAEAERGSTGRSTSGAVKAGENFDWTISPVSKLTQKVSGIWKTSDFGDALYHADIGLIMTVARRVDLKLAYAYDYKTHPGAIGIKKGDSALFATFLMKF